MAGGGFCKLPNGSVVVALTLPSPRRPPATAVRYGSWSHAANRARALTRLRNLGLRAVYLRGNAEPPTPDEITAVLHHPGRPAMAHGPRQRCRRAGTRSCGARSGRCSARPAASGHVPAPETRDRHGRLTALGRAVRRPACPTAPRPPPAAPPAPAPWSPRPPPRSGPAAPGCAKPSRAASSAVARTQWSVAMPTTSTSVDLARPQPVARASTPFSSAPSKPLYAAAYAPLSKTASIAPEATAGREVRVEADALRAGDAVRAARSARSRGCRRSGRPGAMWWSRVATTWR